MESDPDSADFSVGDAAKSLSITPATLKTLVSTALLPDAGIKQGEHFAEWRFSSSWLSLAQDILHNNPDLLQAKGRRRLVQWDSLDIHVKNSDIKVNNNETAGKKPTYEAVKVGEMSPEELEEAIEKELARHISKVPDAEIKHLVQAGLDWDISVRSSKVSPRVTAIARKLKAIPEQGPGPHFALSPNSKITQMKPSELDETGNDTGRINGLLPLIKDALGDLEAAIGLGSNTSPGLVRDINKYRDAINSPEGTVQWAVIWGLGVRLQNASIAAERDVMGRMIPALEDETKGALDALLDFHGPLIMATSQGRELQEQADKNRMTRADQHKVRNHAAAISKALGADDDLVEQDAADIADIASDVIGQGSHPERGTTFGVATIRSIAIVLLSGAIAASPHELIQTYPAVSAVTTMAAWEVAKKTAAFTSAVKTLGIDIDRLAEWTAETTDIQLPRFMPFRRFVLANDIHLRGIAQSSPSLRWLNGYIDLIQAIEKAAVDRLRHDKKVM